MESLGAYLMAQRKILLEQWHAWCDANLLCSRNVSHAVFQDRIPELLDRLLEQPVSQDTYRIAAQHGSQRYQQGYSLGDLLRELAYVRKATWCTIRAYGQCYAIPVDEVYEQTSTFWEEVTGAGIEQFTAEQTETQQQQTQAVQQTLNRLHQLEQERQELMRITTHDLRGSLGMVEGAASLISQSDRTPEQRQQILQILNRNLENVHALVEDITALARLKTLKEVPETFDVASLLQHIIEKAKPQALARGLTLQAKGAEYLSVMNDAHQTERLIQTLLVYLIRQTPEGSQRAGKIILSWDTRDDSVWVVTIQDTNPGQPLKVAQLQRLSQELTEKESNCTEENLSENLSLFLIKHLSQSIGASLYVEPVTDGSIRYEIHFTGIISSIAEMTV